MADIAIIFVVTLILRVSLSLPISQDVKTVQSTDSVSESEQTDRTPVRILETILRLEEDYKLVQKPVQTDTLLKAFESFEADHGKRMKRYIATTSHLCPKDMFAYHGRCLKEEQYKDVISEDSDDYEAER